MKKNNSTQVWSDSVLEARIMTYGYQMAEMGRQQAFEAESRNRGDYGTAHIHASRAEMYRVAAYDLVTDINAQLTLRRTSTLVSE